MIRHQTKTIRGVIFDFDGTLTPLTLDFGILRDEVAKVATIFGAESLFKELKDHYIIEAIYEVEKKLGSLGRKFRERALEMLDLMEIDAAYDKRVYPFTEDVLNTLRQRGVSIGIITRTSSRVVFAVFPEVLQYVDAIMARDNIKNVKPHPEHVFSVLRLLSSPAAKTIIVGDHPTDIMAGNAAGTMTAGVLTGRTSREAFSGVGANYILEDIRGLLSIVP